MERRKVFISTKLDNCEESYEIMVIKKDNVIKYIDYSNNKMIVDMLNNTIKRENKDFIFFIDFNQGIVEILMKKIKKSFYKDIEVLLLEKNRNYFFVKYLLLDENVINEYCLKL